MRKCLLFLFGVLFLIHGQDGIFITEMQEKELYSFGVTHYLQHKGQKMNPPLAQPSSCHKNDFKALTVNNVVTPSLLSAIQSQPLTNKTKNGRPQKNIG